MDDCNDPKLEEGRYIHILSIVAGCWNLLWIKDQAIAIEIFEQAAAFHPCWFRNIQVIQDRWCDIKILRVLADGAGILVVWKVKL